MQNTGSTLYEQLNNNQLAQTAKGAFDVASTLKYLQDPKTNGAQRLGKIISLIMSYGGSAAEDSFESTE